MTNAKPDIQDSFLNHVCQEKIPTTIFLISGVKLQGFIIRFDACSLLLQREAHTQLVYKHAISTIMPNGSVQLFESDLTQNADA